MKMKGYCKSNESRSTPPCLPALMDSGESSSNGVASSKPRSGRSNDKKTGRNLPSKQPTAEMTMPDIAHQQPEILQDCSTDASQSVAKHNVEADLSEFVSSTRTCSAR
jgi:hypothetical protein